MLTTQQKLTGLCGTPEACCVLLGNANEYHMLTLMPDKHGQLTASIRMV